MNFFKKSVKFLFIFLTVFGLAFSNLPYDAAMTALQSYINSRNVVDKYWHLSKDSNVVDKFIPFGKAISQLRINEAEAAVANNGLIMKGSNASAGTFYYMTVTNPNTFGGETTTGLTSSASGLVFVVEKAAPVRDEKLSGHIKVDGRLDVVRRNSAGTYSAEWNVAGSSAAMTCDATAGSCWRPFDIGYEQLSGQGMVAYGKNATAGAIFYNIYNGSTWAGETQYTVTGSTGVPKWIRLIPEGEQLGNRRSDRILMVMMDANNDIFAAIWSGSAWGNLTTITTTNSVLHSQTFDGAWENNSGDALVVYAEGTANSTTPFRYKQFVNSTSIWDSTGTTVGTWTTSIGRYARLATNPVAGRDDIAVIMQASDVSTITTSPQTRPFIWSGSAMTAGNALTTAESMVGANISVAWEKLATTGEAVFVYTASDSASDTSAYQTWISGTGFSASADIAGNMGDDSNNLTVIGSPNSSEIRIMGMNIDKGVQSQGWSGTGWNAAYSAALGTVVYPGATNTNQEAHGYAYAWTPYSPWTRNWRWYDDEGSATPATALANENTTASVTGSNIVRLRFQAAEMGGMAATASRKKLQYTSCATPDALTCTWTDVDAQAGAGIWRYADGAGGVDDTTFTTTVLTGSDATGVYVENGTAASTFGHGAAGSTSDIPEWDYTIQNNGATNGTTYYFRMWANDQNMAIRRDQTNNSTTYSYPAATAAAPASTLTISASAGSKVANVDSGATSQFVHNTSCTTDATCAAFKLAASGGAVNVTSITVSETDSLLGAVADLSNAVLIYDTDANYFNGTAGTFGTDATFSPGTPPNEIVTFTNAGLSIPNGSTYYFYISTDFANGAARPDGGLAVNFQIAAASDVISNGTESGSATLAGTTTILPNVTSITYPITSPLNGSRIGQSITINGAGFGDTCDGTNNRVTIGGVGNVVSCTGTTFSDTSISITNFQYSSGDSYGGAATLLTRIGVTDDNASQDMYVYPDITDVTNPTAYTNAAREYSASDSDGVITINGNHFGTSQGSGSVTVLGQTANIVSWASSTIQIQIPTTIGDGDAGAADYQGNIISYQGTGGNSSASDTYGGGTYRILPRIISTGPVNLKGGQSQSGVSITGNHLCQDASCVGSPEGTEDITFNAVSGKTGSTWGHASITTITVPATATDGNLILTSDGDGAGTFTSNALNYNVKFGPTTPTGSSSGGSNNPTLNGNAFSDGTDGDTTHQKTQWQLAHSTDGDWSTPEWSRTTATGLTSAVVDTTDGGTFANGDVGQTALDCGGPNNYKGRVRYMDNGNGGADTQTWEWSSYSADYTFTTGSCNASPTISISQPPSGNVNVTQGNSYNITYTLNDTDNIVVANFYYDTNASGLDGTVITGCQSQIEGTNATCSWNTTGYPLGTYYVYGTSTDSINPQVNAYSAGTITIQAPPQVTASSVGTQTVNLDSGAGSQYIGAAFTFQQNNGTADTITALTISETGSVSASSTLSTNAGVRYETGVASCTYNGTETLISGTFNTSDKMVLSAISIPVTLSTNYTCVYVVFNIASSTVGGQTIDFEITSSADFTLQNGTTKAGTYPVQLSGSTTIRPNVTSINYPVGGDGAREGDTFAINGAGFGTVAGSVTIQIGSDSITTNSANNTVATGTIQSAFPDTNNGGTNQLLVTVGGTADNASSTFYIYPDITDVTNPTAYTNAAREYSASDSDGIITVNGNHFGNAGSVTVLGSTATATTTATCIGTAYQATCVGIQIPTGIADNSYLGNIVLTRSSDSKTDTYGGGNYRILPRISSTNPANPIKTNDVQIVGDHLCQAGAASCPSVFDADNKITFNSGVDATVFTSWNNTSATTTVPATAQSGNLVLKSNTYDSNALNITLASTVPNSPATLQQFKTNGTTEISVGSGTNETSVRFGGDLSSGVSITMFLEAEVQPIGALFNGTITASSSLFTGTSFTNATATVSGLSGGSQYHWRLRAKNKNTDEVSAWVAYGANPSGDGSGDGSPANTDFYVDTTGPGISGVGTANLSDIQTDITWTTDESANRWVAYATSSCPTGQASASSTFDALVKKEPSSPTGSATSHSVTLTGLSGSTQYYYMVRSADSFGNASFNPSSANTCNNFTTLSPQTRLMKTLEFYIEQVTTTASNFNKTFDVFVSESKTDRTNITFKSVIIEVFGMSVASGAFTVNVNLNGAGVTTYNVANPGGSAIYWNLSHQASGINYDCISCSDTSNTLSVTVTGATSNSMLGAKAMITYYYVPQ